MTTPNQVSSTSSGIVLSWTANNTEAIPNPIQLDGFAEDSFDVPNVEAVSRTIGADGKVKNSVKPVLIKGSLKLFAGSVARNALNAVLQAQINTGESLSGQLLIKNPNTGETNTLNNFIWVDAPVIPGFGVDGVKDVTFNFSYTQTSNNTSNDLVNKLIASARSMIGF